MDHLKMSPQLWQSAAPPSTLTKHLRRSWCTSVHQLLPESSKGGDRPDLCAGLLPLEVLKAFVTAQSSHCCMSMFPVHSSMPRHRGLF